MAQTYLNKKQELFCKFAAEGATNAEAYELAGYEPSSANACTMAAKPLIKRRVAELQKEYQLRENEFAIIAKKARDAGENLTPDQADAIAQDCEWTFQRIMDMMGQNVKFAQIAGEFRSANECLRMMGEALNLFEAAKEKRNDQGNRSPTQNTIALISEVTNLLATTHGGGSEDESNSLRPRLASTRTSE